MVDPNVVLEEILKAIDDFDGTSDPAMEIYFGAVIAERFEVLHEHLSNKGSFPKKWHPDYVEE